MIVFKTKTYLKNIFCHFLVWIQDSRHFQPVLGRKFHVESEFEVENNNCLEPEWKNKEKRNSKKLLFNQFFVFFVFFIRSWGYVYSKMYLIFTI